MVSRVCHQVTDVAFEVEHLGEASVRVGELAELLAPRREKYPTAVVKEELHQGWPAHVLVRPPPVLSRSSWAAAGAVSWSAHAPGP
ncbi:hypothetical protein [Streptomyces paradoxus]|uniref:hypothetical protein n=1 Tax=Streptomyces paradoxus TaxID=66375 RepID=UPI0037D2F815